MENNKNIVEVRIIKERNIIAILGFLLSLTCFLSIIGLILSITGFVIEKDYEKGHGGLALSGIIIAAILSFVWYVFSGKIIF